MDIGQLSAVLISFAGLVLIYNGCYHRLQFPKKISIAFAVTTSLVTFLYLASNPDVLRHTQARIGAAVIALILATLSAVKSRH